MPKFDFNNSRKARFFSDPENTRYLQKFIDEKDIFHVNYGWYLTQGKIATDLTPTNHKGVATFTVEQRVLRAATLANLRAPLAGSFQKDKGALQVYSATIPDFITDGFKETAEEREYRAKQFEEFGNDKDLVKEWRNDVQNLMNSLDMTMNFMVGKLATTGEIDYTGIGRGIQAPLHKAPIPAENFKKCGKAAWADAECNILEQMRLIEYNWRKEFGQSKIALVWQMTYNTFYNVFLNNKQIKELYINWCKAHYVAYVADFGVNTEMFLKAFADIQGISPIEIVDEEERSMKFDGTVKTVKAWNDNIVVLRPAGFAFEYERKQVSDKPMFEKYGNKLVNKIFASTNNGLGLLCNSTVANGDYQEWYTDLMFAAVPAMLDFPYRWIIDITKKGQ